MARSSPITPALYRFLKELADNNDREWFQDNKHRYEQDVKEPLEAFIALLAAPLAKVSPHIVADPRPVGGSMFRIYRDTRFSKDKTPYKTAATMAFRHEVGKKEPAPAFYLKLAPGDNFAGGGIYHPEGPALKRIREAIAEDASGWQKAISGKKFRERFEIGGEQLKRVPRGFDPDHPCADDLRRKSFHAGCSFTQKDACSPDFPKKLVDIYRAMSPMPRFLCAALDLPF